MLYRQSWLGALGCIVAGLGVVLLSTSRQREELLQVAHVGNGPGESAEQPKDLGLEIDRLASSCIEQGRHIATVHGSWHGLANCRSTLFSTSEGISVMFIHYSHDGQPNALMGVTATPKALGALADTWRSNQVVKGRDACAKIDRNGIPVVIITKPSLCAALERDLI